MAQIFADRIKENTTTTGTGAYTLDGAFAGFQTFATGIGTGNQTGYCCTDGISWEVGYGTYNAGTLSRDQILASSNNNLVISWATGQKVIFCAMPAAVIDTISAHLALTGNPHGTIASQIAITDINNYFMTDFVEDALAENAARILTHEAAADPHPQYVLKTAQQLAGGTITKAVDVAAFNDATAAPVGTLKITLPKTWSNTMLRIVVKGFNYTTNSEWELALSGYNYLPGTSWYQKNAQVIGNTPFSTIRFAHDGTNCCILLGTTTTAWAYPKVIVTEVIAGHQNITGWDTGWSMGLITSETGITISGTAINAALDNIALKVGGVDVSLVTHNHDTLYDPLGSVTTHEQAPDPHPQYTTLAEATAAAPVQSVFGRTGDILSVAGDYTAAQITNVPAGNIISGDLQSAINELDTEKLAQTVTDISAQDLNTFLGSGYYIGSNITNAPTVDIYRIFSFSSVYGGTNYVTQVAILINLAIERRYERQYNGTSWGAWAQVWNASNDGAGSTLDSDLLDGHQGTYYLDRTYHTGTQLSSTISDFVVTTQDTVGAMINTQNGITVTYDGVAKKINFDVNDPIISLSGDVSGSATMTNLGNTDIIVTVANDSHLHTTSTITNFGLDVEAVVGAMVSGNVELDINVTFDSVNRKLDFDTLPLKQYIGNVTYDMTGFPDRTTSTISFVDATRTFTLTPLANCVVYYRGEEIALSSAINFTIANTDGIHFLILDPVTLQLQDIGTTPDVKSQLLVTAIYWSVASQTAIIIGDERHSSSRDTQWHYAHHLEVGTVSRSGGGITYTLNNDTAVTFGISTPYVIADEDLNHTINHAAVPANDFEQVLNGTASVPTIYMSGTAYTTTAPSTVPWLTGTTRLSYNPIVAGSGSLTDATDKTFINYWLVATNDIRYPIKAIVGRVEHQKIEDAMGELFVDYGLPFQEMVFAYQVILEVNDSYTNNTAHVVIAEVYTPTKTLINGSPVVTANSHTALADRALADQHPATAITNVPAGTITAVEVQAAINQLDTLKLAASAYTAADVLAKLLTVDGAGSTLDADLLDGQQGTYYLDLANATGVLTVAKGGTGVTSSTGSGSVVLDINPTFGGTGAITLPAGTDAQRPGTPVNGMIRYSTTANSFEGYAAGAWGAIGGGGGSAFATYYDFTATAGQTTFTVTYTPGAISVIRNGITLQKADFTATNGTSVTIGTACALGDAVTVLVYDAFSVANTYNQTYVDALQTSLQTGITDAAGPGEIAYYARNTAPSGWLKANGAAVLIASYSALATAIYVGDANNATALFGYKCTDSTGTTRSTTGTYIVIPDLRGEFLRGWDDARGIDVSRAFGDAQADAFQGHWHTPNSGTWPTGAYVPNDSTKVAGGCNISWSSYYPNGTGIREARSDGTNGTPRTDVETRPRNISLLACIKY